MGGRTQIPLPVRIALAAMLVLLGAPALAWAAADRASLPEGEEARIEVRLVAHPDDAGAAAPRVGVLVEPSPGWHFYSADPGEAALATRLAWRAGDAGVEALPWPAPRRFEEVDIDLVTWGYDRPVVLPARLHGGPGRVEVDVELVVCREECIPAEASLALDLPAPSALTGEAEVLRTLFAEAGPSRRPSVAGLLHLLWLAALGGLLLNAMPCVMPVLAIKALGVAELAHASRSAALRSGAAYALGVVSSLQLLALCAIGLAAAGTRIGWGFQFQEPLYVAGLASLLVLVAANFLGAFEIHAGVGRLGELGRHAVGARRSFFDGLLCVALATPCTAPFLGTAVAAALAGPPPLILAVFGAIGVGLAAPLALVAVFPGVARGLPRPGPWMLELRALLGFALLATAGWLVWVAGRLAGVDAAAALVALLLAVGFSGWLYGALQRHGRAPRGAWAALVALTIVALGLAGMRDALSPVRPDAEDSGAARFERARLEATLASGRPGFLYFTADWCITCKVNESLVLRHPRVREAFASHDVAVFRADFTHRDEEVRAELARFGRSGVPLYAVFDPSDPQAPALLPELLSVERVVDAVERAAGG